MIHKHREIVSFGDDEQTDFLRFLKWNVIKKSIKIYHNNNEIGEDNGEGNIIGLDIDDFLSIVNYDAGILSIKYLLAPKDGVEISITYETAGNIFLDDFLKT